MSINNYYCHTAILIHLKMIYGYFCTTMAELNGCNRDRMCSTKPKILALFLHRKSLSTHGFLQSRRSSCNKLPLIWVLKHSKEFARLERASAR